MTAVVKHLDDGVVSVVLDHVGSWDSAVKAAEELLSALHDRPVDPEWVTIIERCAEDQR